MASQKFRVPEKRLSTVPHTMYVCGTPPYFPPLPYLPPLLHSSFLFFFLFFVFDVCLCVATLFVFLSGTMRRIRDVLQLRRVCVTSEFPSRTRWPTKKNAEKSIPKIKTKKEIEKYRKKN